MDAFLKFCFTFWLINQAEGQAVKCDYYHYNSDYECILDKDQSNYVERVTRINGQHQAGYTNADVKYIGTFQDTKFKTFSSIFCQKFPNLERININHVELELIDADSLSNCKNLNHLALSQNEIRAFPEYLLIGNSKLKYISVYRNQLTMLPENFFINQKDLEFLNLYVNQIMFLPSNIFRSLVKLISLDLSDNKLQSINPEWFVNLSNLKKLSLRGNEISEIQSKPFASLRNLEKLWLYRNRIKTLNADSFDGLQNLQLLSLRINEISNLPVAVFAQLKSLQELDLRNNKLTAIHSDSFGVHNQLTEIYLGNNKINAIDEKFIDNTAVSDLDMTDNICSQSKSKSKEEIKNNLRSCFANHQSHSNRIPSSCGRSRLHQGAIVGGTQIKRNSFPWIAALLRPNGQLFCGGTIVSSRKVVTAAHCIQQKGDFIPLKPSSFVVLLGFHDLSNTFEIGRASYAVQSIHIDTNWNPYTTSYDSDIAVLMLDKDVTFNDYIQPICMTSTDSRIAAKTEGYVVGNGKSGEHNEYENIPKILKMPIQTDQHCTETDTTFAQLLSGRTFCAGSGTGQGICSGDSGSGFIVEIGNVFYLRGIVSIAMANSILGCDVNTYSVFTDALKFIDWVNGLSTAN